MNKLFFVLPIILMGCSLLPKSEKKIQLMGEAQGTYYSITYFDQQERDLQLEIDSILDDFDMSVSLWVPESVLSRVNRNDSTVSLDKNFIGNFDISEDVAGKTAGAFDFTIGKLVKAWGFGYDHTRNIDSLLVDSLLQISGYRKVKIVNNRVVKENPLITFDFNAVAQGYSVDVVADYLESKGITNYLIDIGGEVKAHGIKADGSKWRIGVEKPAKHKDDERDLKAVVELEDISIATSGNYRKFYVENGIRYSHTINPHTGYPARNRLLSVSVLHKSTAYADAFATSFMVMGYERSKQFVEKEPDLEAFFIYSTPGGEYATYATQGFKSKISQEFD
ncbi:MAG: FAD:protein FMN transferase [Chlorobi bacterium]|nr:FAD:protein FMN transferase [Chlorobiota bacterium]